jgi:UDP-N-acetylmuramate: L-alanyl-gamma-D-glutamyl-meso-diaminopimelate ligase
MHIHILGICGTFMGGLAVLAKEAGHRVTGCDANVYPPMSTQLEAQGIELIRASARADRAQPGPVCDRQRGLARQSADRGNPEPRPALCVRPAVDRRPYIKDRWVLAVAGTHGKTTTSAMLAWILEDAGYAPGFLIGGVPMNFGVSARLQGDKDSIFFVIEADEYDTAFFDKRSKFVHYHAKTAILNNLEYDHADIFPDLGAIETQFHHLVRTVPGIGRVIVNGDEDALQRVLKRGCWSEKESFGRSEGTDWAMNEHDDGTFDVIFQGEVAGRVEWQLTGKHNRANALAAIAAARHVGVPVAQAAKSLATFESVKRRMEVRGVVNGITVYDDFAHHPTAIATTVGGLRQKVGEAPHPGRAGAALQHHEAGRDERRAAGQPERCRPGVRLRREKSLGWSLGAALAPLGEIASAYEDIDALVAPSPSRSRATILL